MAKKETAGSKPSASKTKAPRKMAAITTPMNQDDYRIEKGTIKNEITKVVNINDKDVTLRTEYSMNNKKGTFRIVPKFGVDTITGDDKIDSATLKTMNSMVLVARDICLEWKYKWLESKKETTDPDQIKMGFDN